MFKTLNASTKNCSVHKIIMN